MKRLLPIAVATALGVVTGVLVTSHVWIAANQVLREGSRTEFIFEQQLLASRAARSGDRFRESLHAINAADAEAELGFKWLQRYRDSDFWGEVVFPWASYSLIRELNQLRKSRQLEKGAQMIEAMAHGRAAIALEQLGRSDHAEIEWSRATTLAPSWPKDRHREMAESSITREMHPSHEAMEAAYLDSRTSAELGRALAILRQEHYPDFVE
jgi:hypothetical protein